MRGFMRAILWKGALLAAGWALIVIGEAVLNAWGDRLGVALFGVALIGFGILLGLGAQVATPVPRRRARPNNSHRRDQGMSPAGREQGVPSH